MARSFTSSMNALMCSFVLFLYWGSLMLSFVFVPVQGVARLDVTCDECVFGDEFGSAVAISGIRVVASAYLGTTTGCNQCASGNGAAYVFHETLLGNGDWAEVAKLVPTGNAYLTTGSYFGSSLASSDVRIVVGAQGFDWFGSSQCCNSGAAFIFNELVLDSGTFEYEQFIAPTGGASQDFSGMAVVSYGLHVLIGAPRDDDFGTSTGSVAVYSEATLGAGSYTSTAKLVPSDGQASMEFGQSIAQSPGRIVIGAHVSYSYTGWVYVFSDSTFSQLAKLVATDAATNDYFGFAISTYGTRIVVGAFQEDASGTNTGSLYIFAESVEGNNDWQQQSKIAAPGAVNTDGYFGHSVALVGQNLYVGASYDNEAGFRAGAVYAFRESEFELNDFTQEAKYLSYASDDYLGYRMTANENRLVVTARGGRYISIFDFDSCASESAICYHGATCADAFDNFDCLCQPGYSGEQCEVNIDDCVDHMCQNGASCIDDTLMYNCTCLEGYAGVLCEEDVDDCESSPCHNSGICTDAGPNSFSCDCTGTGYGGSLCETDIDDCLLNTCENGGTCSDTGANTFSCDCEGLGFEGYLCESDIDDCASSPCLNHGVCKDIGANSIVCVCDGTGYEGDMCQTDSNDCTSSPCLNSGTCVDTGANIFTCDCTSTGFEGSLCQLDIDECNSSPCMNDGICTDIGINMFTCDCIGTGFEGDTCASALDECSSSPCFNGATCIDGHMSVSCICPENVEGVTCEIITLLSSSTDDALTNKSSSSSSGLSSTTQSSSSNLNTLFSMSASFAAVACDVRVVDCSDANAIEEVLLAQILDSNDDPNENENAWEIVVYIINEEDKYDVTITYYSDEDSINEINEAEFVTFLEDNAVVKLTDIGSTSMERAAASITDCSSVLIMAIIVHAITLFR